MRALPAARAALLASCLAGCIHRLTPRVPPEFLASPAGYMLGYEVPERRFQHFDSTVFDGTFPVFLSNGAPHARGHLYIYFGSLAPLILPEDISLVDSDGFRFRIGRGVQVMHDAEDYYTLFEVDEREALIHIRYNDPIYFLTLRVDCWPPSQGQTIAIPRINPTVRLFPPRL
jgi:hypothetical protein